MPPADADPFFIRSRLPQDELAQNFTWSVLVVKISTNVSAYLAFRTKELAQLVLADLNRSVPTDAGTEHSLSVVAASAIDGDHYVDFDSKPVVLFEIKAEVDAVLDRSNPTFPYEQHLYRFSPSTGLHKIDV